MVVLSAIMAPNFPIDSAKNRTSDALRGIFGPKALRQTSAPSRIYIYVAIGGNQPFGIPASGEQFRLSEETFRHILAQAELAERIPVRRLAFADLSAVVCFFEQLSQVIILTAGCFEIEQLILDAYP